jgi:hypothetical protein
MKLYRKWYKCTQTHSNFIWYVLLTYKKYISSNTLLVILFIYLILLWKKRNESKNWPLTIKNRKNMGLSFSVKLHLYLTGNTLIHYGYFFFFLSVQKQSYLFPILDCRDIPYEIWVCLGTFVFVGSSHVGVSMFIIVIKLIILITPVTFFYEK